MMKQSVSGVDYDIEEMIESMAAGKVPVINKSLWGRRSFRYVPPVKPRESGDEVPARLFVIEDYEIASYLGDYGAGRTVKTFSLLPGEKTTVSVKTWRTSSVERTKGENVLDSFSAESSEQYESAIEDELKTSQEDQDAWASGWSHKDAAAQQSSVGVSASMSGKIGPFGGSASASFNHAWQSSSENQSNGSTNAARKSTVDALRKGMDRHVNQSSSARKFEVNTETSEKASTTEGVEESVVRELANINHSRVLNFVFRQLTQEYITLTSLKDVAIGGTWGVPGDGKEARLDTIDAFLAEYVKKERVADVRRIVLNEMNNVYNHEGKRLSFLKLEKETYEPLDADPSTPAVELRYYRRNPELTDEYKGRVVKGVILDVASRILVTDALVVEALLGQGEALDCYNMRLQAAAADKADIANNLSSASVATINALPEDARADAIAKISFPPANIIS